jgi:hypothetical protein
MQPRDTLFTPTEAAVLTGLPLKAVNNAIDKKTVMAVAGERGSRLLDERALLSLSIGRRLADRIAPELRRKLFDALAECPRNVVSLDDGLRKIDLREPRRALAASLRELRRARRVVVSDPEILAAIGCSAARACLSTWSPIWSRRARPRPSCGTAIRV